MSDFARTLETAKDAESVAKLLGKVAAEVRPYHERERLQELARRYTDYAQALRETVTEEPAEPAPDQAVLL